MGVSLELPEQRENIRLVGGGGGIRTHETLSGLTVFKTAGFNRSPTPPFLTSYYIVAYEAFSDNGLNANQAF